MGCHTYFVKELHYYEQKNMTPHKKNLKTKVPRNKSLQYI